MCAPEFQPATLAVKKAIVKWAGSDQAGAVQLVRGGACALEHTRVSSLHAADVRVGTRAQERVQAHPPMF